MVATIFGKSERRTKNVDILRVSHRRLVNARYPRRHGVAAGHRVRNAGISSTAVARSNRSRTFATARLHSIQGEFAVSDHR